MFHRAAVIVLFVHLSRRKAEHKIGGPAVTDHAFDAAGIMPLLRFDAVGMLFDRWHTDFVFAVEPFGGTSSASVCSLFQRYE